jgi:phosphinothricin acetyltransferase
MPQNRIRTACRADCGAIARIYNHYIRETVVTFEEEEVSAADIAARLDDVSAMALPWLIIEEAGTVAGYAYAAGWKTRSAYRFSAESTIYLDPAHTGKGLGTRLYAVLLEQLRSTPIHVVIGGIALPNAASVALHEQLGFHKVAHFREVGFKFSRWIDVGYWQTLV